MTVRVGRKRTIVIPKKIADMLGIEEGSRVMLVISGNKLEVIPLPDAITLSLKGKKVARVTLRELEEESMREQKRYNGVFSS
ncbi:MAG: AbrB/MazE/SpoVT family DNA-binding domain-containing protein [Desulfurococcus sp.]|uniref:AbrB/MazE/SpoVT family DNA-binding domain-containing protein n=1 Tax=Desulfurococcus sp. TaxID=51678 RepID=UPI003174146E